MGQMITKVYVGAYVQILPNQNFQSERVEDYFSEKFYPWPDDRKGFIDAYQGFEEIDVLVPNSSEFALQHLDEEGYEKREYTVPTDRIFHLEYLKNNFINEYNEVLTELQKYFQFEVKSGVVIYRDEIA